MSVGGAGGRLEEAEMAIFTRSDHQCDLINAGAYP